MFSWQILIHALGQLFRWRQLTLEHQEVINSLTLRLLYTLILLGSLVLALFDLFQGQLLFFAVFLILFSPAPSIYFTWECYHMKLYPRGFSKRGQLQLFKLGFLGMILLIVVGPWPIKLVMTYLVGWLLKTFYDVRYRNG
ncbi:hypothetical protein [Deinococcus multiflagellatus]|uniref:Uncharacterized protein n=2 Tax=Deinococcus multiflagellatus TaxID=1656887 RepID=A0ABW1ZV87_9DEIO